MINDDLTKKLAEAAKKILANDNTNDKSDDGEGLDKVQPKAVKKKFDDRKDKDIDNDGDVDSSDEYLHKRRKAISKATKEETDLEEEKTVADYNELIKKHTDAYKNASPKDRQQHSDMIHKYKKARMNVGKTDGGAPKASGEDPEKIKARRLASIKKALAKEEVELEEATELFKKGKMTLTKFAMGKGKGVGLQINYGTKFIQVPEKDIKQLYTAMVYVTKSVPQFKESVEVEEAVELEEASKDWEVVVTMGVNKLKKGQKTVVKARNSAEAIKKAAKAFNINDKLITGKVDANLKEGFYYDNMSAKDKKRLNSIYKEMDKNEKQSKDAIKKGDAKTVDKLGKEYHKLRMQVVNFFNEDVEIEEETLEEGKFDKLQKKLGRINPETLGDVMDGKIKLNPAEKKEFDEFMKGVRKMFASK